ncbi:MAG: Fic family protein [Patescibacteria group bacterium]|mgnify:CR=1 FL=1
MTTFSVKKIGGKQYLYAKEKIYVAKGKNKIKYTSLGRVDDPINKVKKQLQFKRKVETEESEVRTKYWTGKTQAKVAFKETVIQKLEQLRGKLFRDKQDLGHVAQHAMETAFMIDFIYNSNKIEGSKMPKKEVEKIVSAGSIKKNAEVENSLKAISFSPQVLKKLSINKIIELHKILLSHEPSKHGIREVAIVVGNSDTAQATEIIAKLSELLDWYNSVEGKLYPPELAFRFYYRFERIHPFVDGNGRIGRILMNSILKSHRYHPIILWNSQREKHMNVFEKAMEGHIEKYLDFMTEQMVRTYQAYIKKLDDAASLDKYLQTFLKPTAFED